MHISSTMVGRYTNQSPIKARSELRFKSLSKEPFTVKLVQGDKHAGQDTTHKTLLVTVSLF